MKQDYNEIEELIERFFEGQTSNEEERKLYDFFSTENVPERLLPYRPVFAYFETGIKEEESNHQTPERKNIQPFRKKKVTIWASIAASILILISFGIYHFTREKEFNPYEGSYIIRNGVKITDPKIVNPKIEKTLYLVQLQEENNNQLLRQLNEIYREDLYEKAVREIKQRQLEWINQLEDENIRNEVLKIINF